MRSLKLLKFFKAFGLLILLSFAFPTIGQSILPVNQGSYLWGPEELCAEEKGEYKFKHPTKDCMCDDIKWTVNNGVFDPPLPNPPLTYPLYDKVKVKWDKGESYGTVSLKAEKCFTRIVDGQPVYVQGLEKSATYTVHIFDADMVILFVSEPPSLDCNTSVITLMLTDLNAHLRPNHLENIQWTIPSNWSIQPNQKIGSDYYGLGFPNAKISTNGHTSGQFVVSVSYDSPNFCSPKKSYSRTVTFNIGDCKPIIAYPNPPTFHQSHSAETTNFTFTQPSALSGGSNYTFAAGEEINLETNFEILADAETTFDAFIASCGCNSPWHDPNNKGQTSVTFAGNYNKKSSVVNDTDQGTNNQPLPTLRIDGEINIYPNPSGGSVWLEAININHKQKIILHNAEGRMIFEGYHDFDLQTSFNIDLQNQPKGLYIITVIDSHSGAYRREKLILE